jgi:hypothetical protein
MPLNGKSVLQFYWGTRGIHRARCY